MYTVRCVRRLDRDLRPKWKGSVVIFVGGGGGGASYTKFPVGVENVCVCAAFIAAVG